MKVLLLVGLAVALGLGGDVVFKKDTGIPWWGFGLYAASGLPVWIAYRNGTWMQIGVLWQALVTVLNIGLGILLFSEVLTTKKLSAFLLALIAAWLAQ